MDWFILLVLLGFSGEVVSFNFPFESKQLKDSDVLDFPDIRFGNNTAVGIAHDGPECKAFPDSSDWPIDTEWARLNMSLGGVLLKPTPPGAVCYKSSSYYNAMRCNDIIFNATTSRFYIDDPLTVLTSWTQGDTCPAKLSSNGTCTQGGFPSYVVNATTVKHVQIAINFARNRKIRLVIKNTGHDFNGRSVGAGSLSIWTHNLKSFEFLANHDQGAYSGMAARVASGLEAWEMYRYMEQYNMTLVVPGGSTVGAYGGWMAGGGHSILGSYYGLGSDQPLSLQVVTADGRFVTADTETNQDLYYALRGGGPGTYGVVTSAVVKAYPPIIVTSSSLALNVERYTPPTGENSTWAGNFSLPGKLTSRSELPTIEAPVTINSTDAFWSGFDRYNYFGKDVVDANGTAYSYISRTRNGGFSFTATFEFPGKTKPEVKNFIQSLIFDINSIGIPVKNEEPTASSSWSSTRHGQGDSPGNPRFASRLFPRRNFEDDVLFKQTMSAIRDCIEANYTFHGVHVAPTESRAGYPAGNGVNPAFRTAIMHADVFEYIPLSEPSPELIKERHAIFNSYMERIRSVTPEGGAYVNEADVQEPHWQVSFWGDKYDILVDIKRKYDPWGLFWAPTTVGSEGWAVKTADGLPTQNGRLCRV